MIFSYRAKNKNGEIFEDAMDANDRFALARELKSRDLIPLSISKKKNGFLGNSSSFSFFSKIKTAELMIFTKNLSGMLSAGLSLSRALSVLQKQTKKVSFKKILDSLLEEINAGGTLSSGLAKFPKVFSKLFVSMTRAGEESGNLANSLSEVGASLEKSHALTKKVKGALTYPAVIVSAMVIIGILMFAFVVPTLAGTFKDIGAKLPASTQFIVGLGNFFSEHLLLAFVLIFGTVFGLIWLFKAKFMKKYVDFAVLRIPIIGTLTKQLNTARTARTIASLLLAGVTITRSIEITREVVQNIYYQKVLDQAKEAVEKGASFSEAFKANPELYPIMMAEMIQVGEETGKLSDMLRDVAVFYEGEVENKTKNLSTIIEPVLMVIVGGAVGFFAVSMISPLYSVMSSIK